MREAAWEVWRVGILVTLHRSISQASRGFLWSRISVPLYTGIRRFLGPVHTILKLPR